MQSFIQNKANNFQMKKTLPILFLVLICISGIIGCLYYTYNYIVVKGGPSTKTFTLNGCSSDYIHFITDNQYQVQKTHGHAVNNIIELGGAKIEVAKCLCDSYLTKKNSSDSTELINILNSLEYAYAKSIFENSVEDFNTDTLHIERICKEKNKYFGRLMMD